jgi:uncharacterized protein (DUF2141 family)
MVMGDAQLYSVPYAMVSGNISGILPKLAVKGTTSDLEEALFEVKNKNGQTIFAVYNEGVRIWVDDGSKGTKGGFAVGGFDMTKEWLKGEYLRVTRDSTRVYVKDAAKGTKGGFAVGGFDMTKGATGNFLGLTKDNYFVGHESGSKISTGLYNSVIGYQAGKNLTTGSTNTIIGHQAGFTATSGLGNILMGDLAGYSLTTGEHNTLIGNSAGYSHTAERYTVMIRTASGYYLNSGYPSGSFNTFMGINSGHQVRNSRDNVFLGTNAGYWLDNGRGNTFIGIDAGRSQGESGEPHAYRPAVTADYNIFMGYKAGYYITNGDNNLAIGYEAGYNNADGTGNVFLGYQAGRAETTSNKLYIANSSTNPLIYGDFSTKQLGINTTTLTKTLNVGGDANISGNLTAATLNGTLTGSVNGASNGKVFFNNASGIVVSIYGGQFDLYWDYSVKTLTLRNTTGSTYCWFTAQKMTLGTSTFSYEATGFTSATRLINTFASNSDACVISFGDDMGNSYCTVWLQYSSNRLVGHYIKY